MKIIKRGCNPAGYMLLYIRLINQSTAAPAVPANKRREGLKMNKTLKKIDAAMNEYYEVNGIEFNPFDDEEEDRAIEYAAKKLGMTIDAIIAELD